MRSARLILPSLAAILSLTTAAVAANVRAPSDDGTLSVQDGRVTMQIRMRGGIIGRFARGKLTITDPVGSDSTVVVRGAETERDVNERTTVYSGVNVRFRIVDDRRFVVKLNGSKLNFSAVGRGDGWLDGWGDPVGGIFFDGTFSLNGGPYRSIPNERERFELAAPPTD